MGQREFFHGLSARALATVFFLQPCKMSICWLSPRLLEWCSPRHRVKLDVRGIIKKTNLPHASPSPSFPTLPVPALAAGRNLPSSAAFSLSLSPINFAFEIPFMRVLSPLSTANPEGLALTPARLICIENLLAEFPVSGLRVFNVFHTVRPHSWFPGCFHLGGLSSKP